MSITAKINPYADVDFNSIQQIVSLSHAHTRKRTNNGTVGTVYQYYLDNIVTAGYRHIALSNYYPSEPFDPLSDWFETVPEGLVSSPNAEHFYFGMKAGYHINGLGCTFVSGQAGGLNPAGMEYNGIYNYKKALDAILNTLVIPDGGGVTINHPAWSYMNYDDMFKLLDYDDRVLGIEIANTVSQPNDRPWAVDMWDYVLMTGRRCWGFAVPDHEPERTSRCTGRNILLVENFTSNDCLRAYRKGEFYSKIYDSELAFADIRFENGVFSVSAPLADSISIVVDGVYYNTIGNNASKVISDNATYCRAEASMDYEWRNSSGELEEVTEKIFTNPVMFKVNNYTDKIKDNTLLLLKDV